MSKPLPHFDAIIIGGGLAGASLAVGLARRGRRVAVVETVSRQANHRPSHDDRTLALNQASLNILGNLGLLPASLTLNPIRRIVISRAGGFGHLDLCCDEFALERFGAVAVARELGNVMLTALAGTDGITEFCPDRLLSQTIEADRVRVRLESGQIITAPLLIGADGTHSMVRQAAGIDSWQRDYGQHAMIFNVRPQRCPPATAYERFTPEGPLALLPQPAGRLGVVWIDSAEAIEAAKTWSDNHLLDRLQARFGPGLGQFADPGRRASYPLALHRTPWPIAERVVIIGNAANTVHPVSAQGFNLGLRDVAALIDCIGAAEDPGAIETLNAYARQRQDDQEQTVSYTDTLARAFTNPLPPARLASGLGLALHAASPALRRRLVQAAMGFREPVSELARDSSGHKAGANQPGGQAPERQAAR